MTAPNGAGDLTQLTAAIEAGDARAAIPLYEELLRESGDPPARRAAAEALERFGLLRRRRNGPSPAFVWLVAMTLIVCAGAAWTSIGPLGGIAFALLAGVAGVLVLRRLRRPSGPDDVFLGPRGEEIPLPR